MTLARRLVFCCFIAAFVLISAAVAQEMQDVVYLKNGSIIRGLVIEQVPGKSLKIKTRDGSVFVYTMEEVEKITKEEVPGMAAAPSMQNYAPGRFVIAVNPLGFIVGGPSWVGFEQYVGNNFTYQIRADIWTYGEEENDAGYYYKEDETGFGVGVSARAYAFGTQPYSGLFGGFGLDGVFTSWKWEERNYITQPLLTGEGSSFTLVVNSQVGFAIAIGNIRIEPSIIAGYFAIKQEDRGITGFFVAPGAQIGVMF
ncbi:MAG TPA: hypothetical protein VJN65_04715 [Bacteroidota bacterium]|nr:hypothetical protein [Bacteroidota bacterium]